MPLLRGSPYGGFPKLGVPSWGVPVIGTIVYWVYIGVPLFREPTITFQEKWVIAFSVEERVTELAVDRSTQSCTSAATIRSSWPLTRNRYARLSGWKTSCLTWTFAG